MKRVAGTVAAIAAAACFAAPGSAEAAYQPDLECEKAFVAALPGFAVYVAEYTLEHGAPPPLYGPFYPC